MNTSYLTVLLLITLKCSLTRAYVDLFLSSDETSSLFGHNFDGSLFYVFSGDLRQQTIAHRLEIPQSQESVTFDWRSTAIAAANSPLRTVVGYQIRLSDEWSKQQSLTIPASGLVPSSLSSIR